MFAAITMLDPHMENYVNRFYVIREKQSCLAKDVHDAINFFEPAWYSIGGFSNTLIKFKKKIVMFYPWSIGKTPYEAIYRLCWNEEQGKSVEETLHILHEKMDFNYWVLAPITKFLYDEIISSTEILNVKGFLNNNFIVDSLINKHLHLQNINNKHLSYS